MADNRLHVTNGESFTARLRSIYPDATIISWNEMLCEGPASGELFSVDFINERIDFLSQYDPRAKEKYQSFVAQFDILTDINFDSVVFWFEYDLFCHINMAAAIPYIASKLPNTALFLVCSGHIPNNDGLFGLGELSDAQLKREYDLKVSLDSDDIESLAEIWKAYCSSDHSNIHNIRFDKIKLPYLYSCIQAHQKRFPTAENGLNALEFKALKAIDGNEFIDEHQLVGSLLKDQGYYGFGDLQWFSIVERLSPFYEAGESMKLNQLGKDVILGAHNVIESVSDHTVFGGCNKYDYLYNSAKQVIEKR